VAGRVVSVRRRVGGQITQRYAHLCTDGINALVVRPAPASPPVPEEPELVVYEIPAEVAERAAVVAAQLVGSIGSLRRAAVVSELETLDPLVTGLVTTRSRLGDLNSGPTVYETSSENL
jgi:hypothetical protein